MFGRPRPLTSLACCCLVALAGCSGGSASVGYDSPEACFDGIRDALAKEDYKTALASVTDETQNAFTAGLVMVGSMMKAFGGMAAAMGGADNPEAQKAQQALEAITKVLDVHGVTDEKLKSATGEGGMMGMMQGGAPSDEAVAKIAAVVDDKSTFILEMVNVLMTLGDGQGPDPQELIDAMSKAKLVDLKIDGDTATAKVEVEGESKSQDIEFKKTADGWKLHMNMEDMQGGGPEEEPMEMEMGEMDMEDFGEMGDGMDMEMDFDQGDEPTEEPVEDAAEEAIVE